MSWVWLFGAFRICEAVVIDKALLPFGPVHDRRYLSTAFDPPPMQLAMDQVLKALGIRQTGEVRQRRGGWRLLHNGIRCFILDGDIRRSGAWLIRRAVAYAARHTSKSCSSCAAFPLRAGEKTRAPRSAFVTRGP